ncbi:MAG: FHA domain-containing protein [Anaerolineae bacterium]|nr:FHA domain-containing protein [Anaerolineae bacterium]
MDNALILLGLRLLAGASLLVFLGSVIYFLRRETRLYLEQMQAQQRFRGRLVVISSPTESPGTVLPLMVSTSLGRAPTNTIQIHDRYASNEHARVIWRLGQWWLEDQQSSNGTRVNNLPVTEPTVLATGDIIAIGEVQLRFELN